MKPTFTNKAGDAYKIFRQRTFNPKTKEKGSVSSHMYALDWGDRLRFQKKTWHAGWNGNPSKIQDSSVYYVLSYAGNGMFNFYLVEKRGKNRKVLCNNTTAGNKLAGYMGEFRTPLKKIQNRRLNEVIHAFAKKHGTDIKLSLDVPYKKTLYYLLYPGMRAFEIYAPISSNISGIFREYDCPVEICYRITGSRGKATKKKFFRAIRESGGYYMLDILWGMKNLVPLPVRQDFMDNVSNEIEEYPHGVIASRASYGCDGAPKLIPAQIALAGLDRGVNTRKFLQLFFNNLTERGRFNIARSVGLLNAGNVIDSWRLMTSITRYGGEYSRTPQSMEAFHDELIRVFNALPINRERRGAHRGGYNPPPIDSTPYEYPKEIHELYGLTDPETELSLVVPENVEDLRDWGRKMSNCVGAYHHRITEDSALILGVLDKKGKMLYNIEVVEKTIRQFYGPCNQQPRSEDKDAIVRILENRNVGYLNQGGGNDYW